jgi:hypothetical protein
MESKKILAAIPMLLPDEGCLFGTGLSSSRNIDFYRIPADKGQVLPSTARF